MNKNLEELKEEYIKYPYLIESDLEIMFSAIRKDKRKFKRTQGTSTPTDRIRTLKMLKEHIEYIIDNGIEWE